MAASPSTDLRRQLRAPATIRLGRESGVSWPDGVVEWHLRRNCSLTPNQLLYCYLALCVLSLGVASFFWLQGARMVMPFAWIELLAVGAALLVYARHATDREWIELKGERLTVERACGRHLERVEFRPDWVRVEPTSGDHSLVELSGQGQRIAVGRFIRPELRRQLADELRLALRRSVQRRSGNEL